jgi:signal peptidase I
MSDHDPGSEPDGSSPQSPPSVGATGNVEERDELLFGHVSPTAVPDPSWSSTVPVAPAATPDGQRRGSTGRNASSGSFLRELPVLLLIAFVLAFLLRTFIIQVFFIPSSSMEQTLQVDDRMVVEKLTYRFREPQRGEIVVFEGEGRSPFDVDATVSQRLVRGFGQFLGVIPANARDFVKRVIGLPGDEILIEAGQVYVNGAALDEPYVVYEDLTDFGPVTVPADRLFFLGDNRPNSSDSRRSLGFVPREQVVGRAFVIIWPFEHAELLTGVEHQVPAAGTAPAEADPGESDPSESDPGESDPGDED